MNEQKPRLAEYLEPDTSDQRVNRLWVNVASRQRRTSTGRWVFAGALVAASVAAFVTWFVMRPSSGLEVGTAWEAAELGRDVTMPHVRMQLASQTLAKVERVEEGLTRVRLERGRASFDVEHREQHRFEVSAGEALVRVVGTRFAVQRIGAAVEVEVERGIVEVERAGATTRLTAGQRWPSAPVVDAAEPAFELEHEGGAEERPEPVTPSRLVKRRTVTKAEPAPPPEPRKEPELPGPPAPSAQELFAAAIDARRTKQPKDAVAAFERFLTAFPSDARAPLAHFEVGRLEMDALGNPAAAVTSLRRALAGPSLEVREEATSRLVRALDALGRTSECETARADYLARWPSGSYAETVSGKCKGR